MGEGIETPVQSDWYSPWRLHDSPTHYDFPGDRFIPNRSLMNLDQAHSLLTNSIKEGHNPNFNEAYREKLRKSLTLDLEGRPFRMLVFRGSPKSSRKSVHVTDAMRRDDADALSNSAKQYQSRRLPKRESRILDAPNIENDFFVNIMDWGKNNILAVALGTALYLWNSEKNEVRKLFQVEGHNDYPTSVVWSEDGRSLAIGYMHSKLQLWDIEKSKCIQSLRGHAARVGTISWNGYTITSGSLDKHIINHDARTGSSPTSCIQAHGAEVCGLKWSNGSNLLASGGNDNVVCIWDASKMSSSNFLHRFGDHCSAVKALAWCPHQFNVLASGGGTDDRCIKIWNIQKGKCVDSVDTKAQICGLEWSKHHKEILSGHGYGVEQPRNNLCLWKYPSMTKVGEMSGHISRIINLCQSPDGLTVVSAGADETLRLWEIFGPPCTERVSGLDGLLSLKSSPIR